MAHVSLACCAPPCIALNARLCARCLGVAYCSKACQRADYAAHKPACLAAACEARITTVRDKHTKAVDDARAAVAGANQSPRAHLRHCQALFARLRAAMLALAAEPLHAANTSVAARLKWSDSFLVADVLDAQLAASACGHTAKALVMVRTRGVSFESAFSGAIGALVKSDFSPSENEVLVAQGAVSTSLQDFLLRGDGRDFISLTIPLVLGQLGPDSHIPQWACSKVRALFELLEYRPSRFHGTGLFAKRAIPMGEVLLSLDAEEVRQRARAGADLGLNYDCSDTMCKFLDLIPKVCSVLGAVNDAVQPHYGEVGKGGAAAADELASYTSASTKAVNLAITHPQSAGGSFMYRDRGLGFLCLRVAAVRAIAAGEELTCSYGTLRWVTDVYQAAVSVRRENPGVKTPVEGLRALAFAVAQKAPEALAAQLGVRSLSDLGGPQFVQQTTAWCIELEVHKLNAFMEYLEGKTWASVQ